MPDFLFDFGALDSDSRRGVGSLFRDHHTMFFVFSIFFFFLYILLLLFVCFVCTVWIMMLFNSRYIFLTRSILFRMYGAYGGFGQSANWPGSDLGMEQWSRRISEIFGASRTCNFG